MIVFSSDAILDVARLRKFFDDKNPDLFDQAFRLIWAALDRLETFPDIGLRTADRDIRQLVVRFGRAGYIVRYAKLSDGNILVTRIWHSREARI